MRARLHFDRVAAGGITLPFLVAAPFFGALAAVLLLFAGSETVLSRWHPALIGAMHIYTIGFLLFSIAGALLQIGPVVTARAALQSESLARVLRLAIGAGALLLGCGLFHSLRMLLVPAVLLLSFALPAWLLIAIRGCGFSKTSSGLLFALGGLAIGIGLGLRLAAGHAFPSFELPRQLTNLHAGWMLFGAIAPLVMAVGVIVIPMFQHTRPLPRATKWLPAMAFCGMLFASFPGLALPGAAVAALSLMTFAIIVLHAQAERRHANSDASVQLFRLAMWSALLGTLLWAAAILLPELRSSLQWSGGVLLIAGFAGSSVHGMALKVVPFLVRLRLQRALWEHGQTAMSLPGFQDLLPYRITRYLPPLCAITLTLLVASAAKSWLFVPAMLALIIMQLLLGAALFAAVINGARAGAAILDSGLDPGIETRTFKENAT